MLSENDAPTPCDSGSCGCRCAEPTLEGVNKIWCGCGCQRDRKCLGGRGKWETLAAQGGIAACGDRRNRSSKVMAKAFVSRDSDDAHVPEMPLAIEL